VHVTNQFYHWISYSRKIEYFLNVWVLKKPF